nr:hypothetical protein [Micromonospora sp. DSM 115978]
MIAAKISSGDWSRLLPGVYLTDRRPTSAAVWAHAAILRWGRDIVVSHTSAAQLMGLPIVATPTRWVEFLGLPPEPPLPNLTLTVSASRRLAADGIAVVRRRQPVGATTVRHGVHVTPV